MRGMRRRWRCRLQTDGADGAGLAATPAPFGSLRLEPLAARVIAARRLGDGEEADRFLNPKLTHLLDPSGIPDLDRAAVRLMDALSAGERIVVYGDYDVDGITAASILYHMLRAAADEIGVSPQVSVYIPHRLDEGYGLNAEALRTLADEGARVVVSVDCGITARAEAIAAEEAGLDLIITDHHNPPASMDDLPRAFAVVHPRRPDSAYGFGELCGAGVAYKLAWRLATLVGGESGRAPARLRELLIHLLGFAALGTIADVVPLVGENRTIARFGLVRVRHTPFVGLRALVEASGLAGERVKEMDVGFRLGPRLNAAGRMGHAHEALELFTTTDEGRAAEIAEHLTRRNEERRAVERRIVEQACEMAEAAGMTGESARAIVLAHEDWHPGVVGIVCSRLTEKYGRPAILLCRREGRCEGSGRSIEGFNLHAALDACSSCLSRFGGHDMAAGMALDEAEFDRFVDAFTAQANGGIDVDELVPRIDYDCEATLPELTADAVSQLEGLSPFGAGNPRVRVRLRGARLERAPEPIGAHGKHLKLSVADGRGSVLRLVAWGWGDERGSLPAGAHVEAVVRPCVSEWRGRVSVEPELEDIAVVEREKIAVRSAAAAAAAV